MKKCWNAQMNKRMISNERMKEIHNKSILFEELIFKWENEPLFYKLSFKFDYSGFNVLFGQSGIGKTTLGKIIAGIYTDYVAKNTTLPKKVLFSHSGEKLPHWQKVGSHLDQVVNDEKKNMIRKLLKVCKLDQSLLNHKPSELSTGQINRFNLIRYLLQDFDLLILDEVLSNVDELTRLTILAELKTAFKKQNFLYITHQLLDSASFAKKIIVLKNHEKPTQISLHAGLDLKSVSYESSKQIVNEVWELINLA